MYRHSKHGLNSILCKQVVKDSTTSIRVKATFVRCNSTDGLVVTLTMIDNNTNNNAELSAVGKEAEWLLIGVKEKRCPNHGTYIHSCLIKSLQGKEPIRFAKSRSKPKLVSGAKFDSYTKGKYLWTFHFDAALETKAEVAEVAVTAVEEAAANAASTAAKEPMNTTSAGTGAATAAQRAQDTAAATALATHAQAAQAESVREGQREEEDIDISNVNLGTSKKNSGSI